MPAVALRGALALLTVASLAGCSVTVDRGAEAVPADRLAEAVDTMIREVDPGAEVSELACDGPLEPEVGAEQRCSFSDEADDRYGMTVLVTGIEGDELVYDLDVDPGQTVEAGELEPELVEQLTRFSGGIPPDDVDCPDDLPGQVGATTTCVLTAGTDRVETVVTVTSAEGPDVAFDIEVADQPLD